MSREPAQPFSLQLRESVRDLWQQLLEHPFVNGIAEGTLSLPALMCWVRQDYRFLIEYCRLLARGAARAPDWDTLVRFTELLNSTAHTEMEMHRAYAREFGIDQAALEREPLDPVNRAYTDFLLRVAATADFAELAAALLPCMWGYADIGRSLTGTPPPADERMRRWIDMYADPAFAELSDWCCALVDDLADDAGPATRARMREAFAVSTQYEIAFLDMAWAARADPLSFKGGNHA
jgi:thiaminase/transcriptional activator TenA